MKKIKIIALAAFILSSCDKEMDELAPKMNDNSSSPQQLTRANSKAINESLDKAALIIATSLKQKEVRSFIKAEALKQFDGDYNILYKSAKIRAVNGRSLESVFSGNMQGRFARATTFENLTSNIPDFQISVPVHCEKWDENSFTPLVAIVQAGVDEKELKQIKAYDSEGKAHYLDAKTEPKVPVIVVGISERVDEKGALKYKFEGVRNLSKARVNGQNTILGQIKCPDLSKIESWANGRPELRLRVLGSKLTRGSTTPTALTITTKYYNPERKNIDEVWYTVNTSLFNWYRYWTPASSFVYGSEVKLHWVEEDGGSAVNVKINLGGTIGSSSGTNINVGVSTSFTIKDDDEDLGDALVYYTDGTYSNEYEPGDLFAFELD